jgi:radical SAM protein with 4Fe4S-binding SPASM domain
MKKIQPGLFFLRLNNKKERSPLFGQIELTYRCNLNCIDCYCKGSEDKNRELSAEEWKKILDEVQKEGCLLLCLTGGEPLIRDDFLEIYSYAKAKGFIITLFTNGYALSEKIVAHLAKSPPHSIEITLNSITQTTYESITQRKGSFSRVIENIKLLKEKKLRLILKTNCLKANRDELGRIKKWTEELLGKSTERKYRFKYDPMIEPRLNQDKTPTNFRLSFEELEEIRKQDPDIWKEYQKGLHNDSPDLKRDRGFLYNCNAWNKGFFIDPFGRLKFCMLSDKFSVDLRTASFKEGFYEVFPQLLNERFKTNSKCRDCSLRPICYYCPARAYLETGNEEGPVPYYCELAEKTAKQMHNLSLSG